MVDFKKDTWIYILIAAVLVIIGLFTPVAATNGDIYYFWSGILQYWPDPPYPGMSEWQGGNAATLWTLGVAAFSAALLLWYGIHNMKGMEFKWDWLAYVLIGVVLIIMPILMLVYDSTSGVDVHAAPILILIGGIVAVVAFVLEKFLGE